LNGIISGDKTQTPVAANVCRCLDDSTNLYASSDDTAVAVKTLARGDLVNIGSMTTNSAGQSFVEATTMDGTPGYFRGDVKLLRLAWKHAPFASTPAYAGPVVVATPGFYLGRRANVLIVDQIVDKGKVWLKVCSENGNLGFVSGTSEFLDPMTEKAARMDITRGALSCLGGIVATIIGYIAAIGGGIYIIFWGAILYGASRCVKGMAGLRLLKSGVGEKLIDSYVRSETETTATAGSGYYQQG